MFVDVPFSDIVVTEDFGSYRFQYNGKVVKKAPIELEQESTEKPHEYLFRRVGPYVPVAQEDIPFVMEKLNVLYAKAVGEYVLHQKTSPTSKYICPNCDSVQARPGLCGHCGKTVTCLETVVTTAHTALAAYLYELGIVRYGTPILTAPAESEVIGKHAIGILPIDLASKTKLYTEVTLNIPEDLRGQHLNLTQIKLCRPELKTYKVRRI